MKTLKAQILEQFPTAVFSRHETDLYVKDIPGLREWLKENYEFYSNVKPFISQLDKTTWLDIPFAAWDEKYTPYQPKTGAPCSCRPGVQRDNCQQCEGTGMRIDFATIRKG